MLKKYHLYWLAGLLTLIGFGLFGYKVQSLDFPLKPGTTTDVWEYEVKIKFQSTDKPQKLKLAIPSTNNRYTIIDENFVSGGFGLATVKKDGSRHAIWSIRKAKGDQTLYYKALLQQIQLKDAFTNGKPPVLQEINFDEAKLAAAKEVLADSKGQSADVESFVGQLIQHINNGAAEPDVALLLGTKPTIETRAETIVQLLAINGTPARVMRGILLKPDVTNPKENIWIQVYENNNWRSFDPNTGSDELPANFLPLSYGSEALAVLKGGKKLTTTTTIRKAEQTSISAALIRTDAMTPALLNFSLLGLPLQTQEVYRVLLLIPVGALVLVFLRNIIGVKTFGTFMPVLIALAFRETQLLWGVILFTVIVGLGLTIRFYLEQLKLLLVPRLVSVLIVVVIIMAIISVVSHKLGIERGLSVALFPMVILAMTIERMSIVWEERGASEAISQGIGSLFVATLSYLVMINPYIEHLVFFFPELLLILLAMTLLLGRYSGYRILELRRFKVLAKELEKRHV